MDMTPRTAIYLRVSSEEQRERQTIATQRDFAERYCALHEMPIYGWYADDGISGTIDVGQRPEGARMLADARAGKFKLVLIYKLDRLGRAARIIQNTVHELEQIGVQVRSMTEAFDTSTPAGRLFMGMLGDFAEFERASFLQRSAEGTNRLARAGVWLGGIIPYGYRVEGKRENARLIVSEERIEGLTETEADIIRLIYSWTVDEDMSCKQIAERLNAMGVPPAYIRDGREILRGKRVQATQGIWRAGRIRNMLVNPVYMGIHRYGTRSKKDREVIEREVAAIVSVETWQRAQEKLRAHMGDFNPNNHKFEYLLRGLIRCGVCGLAYCGAASHSRHSGQLLKYYVCIGRTNYRGIYGGMGQKCPNRPVNGTKLETQVWADVEGFLRNPGDVLAELAGQKRDTAAHQENLRDEIARLQQQAQAKQGEKDTVITLYRRGRIDAAALDRQLDQIQREDAEIRARIDGLHADIREAQDAEGGLDAAGDMLTRLSTRLEEPMTFELKRDMVRALVERITIDTVIGEDGKPHVRARIKYRFQGPDPSSHIHTPTRTGTDTCKCTHQVPTLAREYAA